MTDLVLYCLQSICYRSRRSAVFFIVGCYENKLNIIEKSFRKLNNLYQVRLTLACSPFAFSASCGFMANSSKFDLSMSNSRL